MQDLTIIVLILATTDALFTPFRHALTANRQAGAVGERRADYQRGGIAFVGGGSMATRQEHSRALAEARRERLLVGATGNRPLVKLTAAGFSKARSLACCFVPADVWPMLEHVDALAKAGILNRGFVPEYALLNQPHDAAIESADLVGLELRALPLLISGRLDSNSDSCGRLGYKLTAAGRAALGTEAPIEPLDLLAPDMEAIALYDEQYKANLADRDTWTPLTKDVPIPLSAGLWPAYEPSGAPEP